MNSIVPPEGAELQACLRELSGLLWRERVALDRLADMLLEDVDSAQLQGLYHSISALELHRAIATREAALELGLSGEPTLQQVLDAAPLGWADVFASHRRALIDLSRQVGRLARRGGDEASRGEPVRGSGHGVQRSLREFLN